MIEDGLSHTDELRVLVVGGRAEYWNKLPKKLRDWVHFTLLNYGGTLSAYSDLVDKGVRHENVVGNACNMPEYSDKLFDMVHSNSVIEHVGSYTSMEDMARENFWFPIDPHTAFPLLHWMPDSIRVFAHMHFKLGLAKRPISAEPSSDLMGVA